MSELLFDYQPVHPTTWVYLSSLLMLGLFFKFNRVRSVRNFDLVLMILLSPGLLLVHFGERLVYGTLDDSSPTTAAPAAATGGGASAAMSAARPASSAESSRPAPLSRPDAVTAPSVDAALPGGGPPPATPKQVEGVMASGIQGQKVVLAGYMTLLAVCGAFMMRMLLDPMMVRRPLLEPNLSTGGLAFIGCALFVFLMANVIKSKCTSADLAGPRSADQLLARVADKNRHDLGRHGPGNAIMHSIPSLVTNPLYWREATSVETRYVRTAKTMAVAANLAIVFGIVLIGYRHFGSTKMGLGAATLYLMLPYNMLMAGYVTHVLPAALLIWGVLCYRRPLWAGMFIGMSIGVVYYPIFLLPLWISFYWQRGLMRFLSGVGSMLVLSLGSLVFISADVADYWSKVRELLGIWWPPLTGLEGIWGFGWDPYYRYPVLAAFVAMSGALALWPAQKNLGTLLSCSAAIMLATQFWHGHGGGLFMAWFLPLTLLTVFRPNLEDRVALTVLGEGWFARRRQRLRQIEMAA